MTQRLRSRARSLPVGYQFGDARANTIVLIDERGHKYQARLNDTPRDMSLRTAPLEWNVIEGEQFTTSRDYGDEA